MPARACEREGVNPGVARRWRSSFEAAVAAAGVSGGAGPSGVGATLPGGGAVVCDGTLERQMLILLHQANLGVIALAQIALNNAAQPETKAFAQRMIHDHTAADQLVVGLARSLGVDLTADPKTDVLLVGMGFSTERFVTRLGGLKDILFDLEYMGLMSAEHDNLLGILEAGRPLLVNAKVLDLVTASIEVVQMHRDMARETLDSVASFCHSSPAPGNPALIDELIGGIGTASSAGTAAANP